MAKFALVLLLCVVLAAVANVEARSSKPPNKADSNNDRSKCLAAPAASQSPRRGRPTLAKQRFYWNEEAFRCLAFQSGAGNERGDGYNTKDACEQLCRPMDGSPCFLPGFTPKSKAVPTGTPTLDYCPDANVCGKGFKCQMGMFPTCCSIELEEERYCKGPAGGKEKPQGDVFAASCDDLACQRGFRCQMGAHVAKCCPASEKPEDDRSKCLAKPAASQSPRRRRPTLAKQRFYWSRKADMCLAFQLGAGNKRDAGFRTKAACSQLCRNPKAGSSEIIEFEDDGSPCFLAGYLQNSKGDLMRPRNCRDADACGKGFQCKMGPFGPTCCSTELEEERYCKGPSGEGKERPQGDVFAASCDDLACQRGFRCQMGAHLAKCCPDARRPASKIEDCHHPPKACNVHKDCYGCMSSYFFCDKKSHRCLIA